MTAVVVLSRVTGVTGSLKSEAAPFGVLCGAEEIETEAGSKVTVLIDDTGCAIPGIVAVTVTAVSARTSLSVEIVLAVMSSSKGF